MKKGNFFCVSLLFLFFSVIIACNTSTQTDTTSHEQVSKSFSAPISLENSQDSSLFDGETFEGWEGDTVNMWKIEDGVIMGGSLSEEVPNNDFLCTTQSFGDYILKLKFKLEGTEGFINAGVQFRSQRLSDPAYEMIGYQADIGNGLYGALYDESRRKTFIAGLDSVRNNKLTNIGEWNDYEIRAKGNHIQIFLNGQQTVDYKEGDSSIVQKGLIGLQVHGAGKAKVSYKDIIIQK